MKLNIEKILNEVERERRRKLVIELYKSSLKNENKELRKNTVYLLDGLAIADENLFEAYLFKELKIKLFGTNLTRLFELGSGKKSAKEKQIKEFLKEIFLERRKKIKKEIQREKLLEDFLRIVFLFSNKNPDEFLEKFKNQLKSHFETISDISEEGKLLTTASPIYFLTETLNDAYLTPIKDAEYSVLEKFAELKIKKIGFAIRHKQREKNKITLERIPKSFFKKETEKIWQLRTEYQKKRFLMHLICFDEELSKVFEKQATEQFLNIFENTQVYFLNHFRMYKEDDNLEILEDFFKDFCEQALQPYFLKEYQEAQQIKIEGYKIIGKIGQGTSRIAYLAMKDGFKEPVVIKLFEEESKLKKKFYKRTKQAPLTEVFSKKIENMLDLNECEHIVRINNYGIYENTVFTEEEFMEGGSLEDMKYSSDEEKKVSLFRQALIGLKKVHEKGAIKNLTLRNILLNKELTKAKINDADLIDLHDYFPKFLSGLEFYFFEAPENETGKPQDIKSNIYAIGWCLLRLLTSHYTYPDILIRSQDNQEKFYENLSELTEYLKPKHQKIIKKCLSYNPNDRPSIDYIISEL